jgi:potassium-transporting ATPase KdpC subunit
MTTPSTVTAAEARQEGGIGAQLRSAIAALLALTVLTGVLYPLLITAIAQLVFPYQANGSIIRDANGQPLGSELIGQPFDAPQYFWGRLSATGTHPYNAFNADDLTASSGSNIGPLNEALIGPQGSVQARIDALRQADPLNTAPIPVDLVTASASGLDPHISPAAAAYQANRVAQARGIPVAQVQEAIARHTTGRLLGLFGERRVNVLLLNLDLDGKL